MQQSWNSYTTAAAATAVAAILTLTLGGAQARAATQPQRPGVARISAVSGDVAVRRSDSTTPVRAKTNAPLLTSDYLAVGRGGRAEVQLDDATFVRSGANTQARLATVNANGGTVQLARGTMEMRRFADARKAATIATPLLSVRPQTAGSYRVSVTNTQTIVTPRTGTVEVIGANVRRIVGPGSTVIVTGSRTAPRFVETNPVAVDSFDQWNVTRDRLENGYTGFGLANSGVLGMTQLNSYGNWVSNPQYGQVWVPNNTSANWAPFQNGNWTWEPYYGYTWVGNEPWGWTPYHYGNWFNDASIPGNGWAWAPGVAATPYAPSVANFVPTGYAPETIYQPGAAYAPYGSPYAAPVYNNGLYPIGYSPVTNDSALWVPATVAFLDLLQGGNPSNSLATGLLAGLLGGYANPYGSPYGTPYGQPYYGGAYPPAYGNAYYPASANIGWLPVAPNEPLYPWWGTWQTAPSFVTNVASLPPRIVRNNYYRVVTINNVTRLYRNFNVRNGVTVVSARNFARGQFANRIPFTVVRQHVKTIALVRNGLPIVPTAANLRFSPGTRAPVTTARVALFRGLPAAARVPAFTTVRTRIATVDRRAYRLPAARAVAAELRARPAAFAPLARPAAFAPRAVTPSRPLAAPQAQRFVPRQPEAPRAQMPARMEPPRSARVVPRTMRVAPRPQRVVPRRSPMRVNSAADRPMRATPPRTQPVRMMPREQRARVPRAQAMRMMPRAQPARMAPRATRSRPAAAHSAPSGHAREDRSN